MFVNKETIEMFACSMERRFLKDFEAEHGPGSFLEDGYETNELLAFLFDYEEANDRTKQRFYYLCKRSFADIPSWLSKKYETKFGLAMCGRNVLNSYACSQCDVISGCRGLKHCFSCSDCRFSDHLLFCDGQRHESYMAFNKKITRKRYAELANMLPNELRKQPEFDDGLFDKAMEEITKAYLPKEGL